MYFLYNIVLWLGFLALTPVFFFHLLTGGKWAAGFRQRMGNVPAFDPDGRPVVLLHCVSVGETNAALPLARALLEEYPDVALVVSTTTRTGQEVAASAFAGVADAVVYFPFDLRFAVKRFLRRISPDLVLLTETEIWPNFVRLAARSNCRVAIVNGRLSERSFGRYGWIKGLLRRTFAYIDLALMQSNADAQRIMSLGMRGGKVRVTGNLKFDIPAATGDSEIALELRRRFAIGAGAPLIIAASTHRPEEQMLLDALKLVWKSTAVTPLPRLMLVPRHPERFAEVADAIKTTGFNFARRSENPSARDKNAEVIVLDSIGELKQIYSLADIVFVGGSLIPHGGQSVFEPAAAGKAMIVKSEEHTSELQSH